MAGNVNLYLGDCLEILPTLATGSVDAVITDPPYGIGIEYAGYEDTRENLSRLIQKFMPQVMRLSKRIVLTPGVANILLYPDYTWILSWVNMAGVGSSSWGFSCWQPILVYGPDPFSANGRGRRPDTFIQMRNDVANVDHPCPKPDNVMAWILERTTNPNDIVLDPFMGSGTTGVACMKLGRNFIGIEIEPKYFEIAKRRIEEAQQQLLLPLDA